MDYLWRIIVLKLNLNSYPHLRNKRITQGPLSTGGPSPVINTPILSIKGIRRLLFPQHFLITLIKMKLKFSSYIRKFRMEQLHSHIWLTDSSYMVNICAFSHILRSPFSHMTLQLLLSEFPYIWGKFYFISYQCTRPPSQLLYEGLRNHFHESRKPFH